MKIKRTKKARRTLELYRQAFGIAPPLRVVVDGTFCQAVLQHRISIREQLPAYFGVKTNLFTTTCIVKELESLGEDLRGAKLLARRMEHRKCAHRETFAASECIQALVGKSNQHRFMLGTQDPELKKTMRNIPGVPIVSIVKGTLNLERPSYASLEFSQTQSQNKFALTPVDEKVLGIVRKPEGEAAEPDLGKKKTFKRKAKGANPLSQKKKKKGKAQDA